MKGSDIEPARDRWRAVFQKAFCFGVFLFAFLWIVDALYGWGFSRGSFYKQQWVNGFQDQSFDLIVLGSSRSLTTIDMKQLQDLTGWSAANLSLDGSGPADQLCLLKMFLSDNHNKATRILLQVDHWALTGPGSADDSYRVFLPFRHRKSVATTLAEAFPDTGRFYRWRDRLPMVSYGRCNAYWSFDKLVNSVVHFQQPPFDQSGSYLIDRQLDPEKPTLSVVSGAAQSQFGMIDQILNVCKAHNVEVFMFTAPWLNRSDDGGWKKATKQLADKQVHYRDFGDVFSGQSDFFYDLSHLNKDGAQQFTPLLAEFVRTSKTNGASE